MSNAARNSLFSRPQTRHTVRPDGSILLSHPQTITQPARNVGQWLDRWAAEVPDRVLFAERAGDAWRKLNWGQAHARIHQVAAALIEAGVSAERPVAILSENSVDHAVLALAAMVAGVPAATISTAYSLMSGDHEKLKAMIALLTPRLVFVSDADQYAKALAAIAQQHDGIIVASHPGDVDGVTAFTNFGATPGAALQQATAAVGPDTIARLLFTSGSTGMPKAVITTHGMLTANQEARALLWPMLEYEPPVIVDWLPWSHTFGASHNFNMVLRNGGSLYIDDGRPAPGLINRTVANVKEIRPNLFFNVPRGFDMLLTPLREDAEFRDALFSSRLLFYAGAALPQNVWETLQGLAHQHGRDIMLVSAWGSTETAPLATDCNWQAARSGNIGLPVPGVELKLVPAGDKLEIRVRGLSVTPGYFRAPELTAAAFDEEGFYRIGDAVRFADPADPQAGLYFDGRISEDFKLSTGTWVGVGELRVAAIDALAPLVQDVVVAGHDTEAVALLLFPNFEALKKLAGVDLPVPQLLAHEAVRTAISKGLALLREKHGASSSRHAARARLLSSPPSVDQGEITDKGYVNQRLVLKNRTADVEALFGSDPMQWCAIPGR